MSIYFYESTCYNSINTTKRGVSNAEICVPVHHLSLAFRLFVQLTVIAKEVIFMKKAVRFGCLFLSLLICLSCTLFPASAADTATSSESSFVPITREEYILEKAHLEGITYSEAEAQLDAKLAEAYGNLVSPFSWVGDTSVDNGDTTRTVYGRIKKTFTYKSKFEANCVVNAVMISSNYGSNWVDCNSTGTVSPGSGNYDFIGQCTARIISTSQVRLALDGYFQVETSIAAGMNLGPSAFQSTISIGGVDYYRATVEYTHIEKAPAKSG